MKIIQLEQDGTDMDPKPDSITDNTSPVIKTLSINTDNNSINSFSIITTTTVTTLVQKNLQ